MKRNISRVLVIVLLLGLVCSFSSCGKSNKGKLICGITDFEPMNYKDDSGKWIGFDTEFAEAVGKKLGMEVEFQEIEWGSKYQELEAGTISCIWNGFTANANESDGTKRSDLVDFTYSYMLNQQSVVIKADRVLEFKSIEDLVGVTAAAEAGSAGESFASEAVGDTGKIIGSAAQINTLLEVKAGAVDCAVIDILLAKRLAGSGDYSDLAIADIELDSEVYAVGFKKGSDLRDKVNKAIKELYDDGSLAKLAEKYGLENTLVLDTNFKG